MPTIPGVVANGPPLFSPSAWPGATRILSLSPAGLMVAEAAADARTLLGLGSAALAATGDFDAAGAAVAAYAAAADDLSAHVIASDPHGDRAYAAGLVSALSGVYQPLDSDLTALAALTTTAFGRGLLELANAGTARTTLELGTLATQSGTFSGTSSGTNTGDQSLFSTIAVSGQSNVVADQAGDTLTLVGSGVTITTDASTDTITFTVTAGSPGGSSGDVQFNSGGSFGGATGVVYQSAASPNLQVTAQNAAHTAISAKTASTPTAAPIECRNAANTQTFIVNPAATGIGYSFTGSFFGHLWFQNQGGFSDRPGFVYNTNSTAATPATYTFAHFPMTSIGGSNTSTIFLGSGTVSASVHALVSASPRQAMIQGNGGSGTNIAGGKLILASGAGTGSAAPGDISFQTAPVGSSGTTLNALVEAMRVDGNATSGETRLLLLDITAGTVKRVSLGANDSGGSGFKVLRVPN